MGTCQECANICEKRTTALQVAQYSGTEMPFYDEIKGYGCSQDPNDQLVTGQYKEVDGEKVMVFLEWKECPSFTPKHQCTTCANFRIGMIRLADMDIEACKCTVKNDTLPRDKVGLVNTCDFWEQKGVVMDDTVQEIMQ